MTPDILDALDAEIARLQQARTILSESQAISLPTERKGRGRPKGHAAVLTVKKPRTMSEEGKARIAAAQKKRWAASRKIGTR